MRTTTVEAVRDRVERGYEDAGDPEAVMHADLRFLLSRLAHFRARNCILTQIEKMADAEDGAPHPDFAPVSNVLAEAHRRAESSPGGGAQDDRPVSEP